MSTAGFPTASSTEPSPGTTSEVTPDQLRYFHRNARMGDVEVIMGSLRAHGQYRPVVVNIGTYTGRPYEVLAGNHTLQAIRKLAETHPEDARWNSVKVHWGDWDDVTCTKIVLADNRTAEVGTMDFGQLKDLLDSLPNFEGTGFSDLDYQALSQAISPPSLDDLADEFGDGVTSDDLLERVSLKLDGQTNALWLAHRKNFETDDAAMRALL